MSDAAGDVTISALAAMIGVSKQSVSERVARLEARGALRTRQGPGRTKIVNAAEFMVASGENLDPVRQHNGGAGRSIVEPKLVDDLVYAREQARKTAIGADLAQIELDKQLGRVVERDSVAGAAVRVADALVRAVDQLPSRAEEDFAAGAKDGVAGVRAFRRAEARALRDMIAREMAALAAGPSAHNEPEAGAA